MKKFKYWAFVCFSLLFIGFIGCETRIYDTTIAIFGTVVDADTNAPLQGVLLTLMPSSKNRYTGSLGTYEFDDLEPRQYTITAQMDGYRSDRKTVNLVSGEREEVTFALHKER